MEAILSSHCALFRRLIRTLDVVLFLLVVLLWCAAACSQLARLGHLQGH